MVLEHFSLNKDRICEFINMDPNFNQEEYTSIQNKYKQLFIIRDKLEQDKKEVEGLIEKILEAEEFKKSFLKRLKESKLYLEKLNEELIETNRINILLQEFLEKSHANQDKYENDQFKVETISEIVGNNATDDIGKEFSKLISS